MSDTIIEAREQEAVRAYQVDQLTREVREMRERITRLETVLTRGMLLLMANLAGVATSVGQQVLN